MLKIFSHDCHPEVEGDDITVVENVPDFDTEWENARRLKVTPVITVAIERIARDDVI